MPDVSGSLVYERRGVGKPLILIHGVGSRKEVWNPIVDALAAERDVIAIDLPGFGASPLDGPCRVERLVDRVETLVAELGLDRPDIAGNSMGGGIALELGRRGVAGAVVAFSPIGFWNKAELVWCRQSLALLHRLIARWPAQMAWWVGHRPGNEMLRLMYGQPGRVAPEQVRLDVEGVFDATGFEQAIASFKDYRFTNGHELSDVPVTIAWGSRDALLIYRTQSARAMAELPTATHITIPAAGHLPFSDDPARCVEILLAG